MKGTVKHRSFWLQAVAGDAPGAPTLHGETRADIAIVGGQAGRWWAIARHIPTGTNSVRWRAHRPRRGGPPRAGGDSRPTAVMARDQNLGAGARRPRGQAVIETPSGSVGLQPVGHADADVSRGKASGVEIRSASCAAFSLATHRANEEGRRAACRRRSSRRRSRSYRRSARGRRSSRQSFL